jgi:hypothetical protein
MLAYHLYLEHLVINPVFFIPLLETIGIIKRICLEIQILGLLYRL